MKDNPILTIALTGGGSGGHITPLLSLAQELKKRRPDCELIYIGHKGDNFDTLKISGHLFDFLAFVNGGKFRRYHGESLWLHLKDVKTILLNIRDFFRVIGSTIKAYRILSRTKPKVVFVKGGFVGVPVGLAARLKRIPIITHDSDTVGGLANRIVGRWAVIRAVGMPEKFYDYPKDSMRYVGVPIDKNIKMVSKTDQAEFKKQLGLPAEAHVILAAGGGNGSLRLNELVASIAPSLLKMDLSIFIVHIAGAQLKDRLMELYKRNLDAGLRKRVKVFGFVDQFYKYSAAADLIVSRAGATTIAELAMQAKPCLFIASPFLAAGHQLKNAQDLATSDAAVVFTDDVSDDELLGVINELIHDPSRRRQLADNLHKLAKPQASAELAKIIIEVAQNAK